MKTAVVCCLVLISHSVMSKDLGTVGKTYRIAEKDMMVEIEERAAKVDWKSIIENERKNVKKNVGRGTISLPKADKDSTYYLDMTYILDHDINTYNQQGEVTGVLYPKGFIYNPLDYIKVKETYVIMNGRRKEEVQWFKTKYARTPLVYPLITEGNALEVAETIGRPVYVLRDNMLKTFKLKKTLSVVYSEGRRMRVDEIAVKNEKDKHTRSRNLTDIK